MNYFFSAARLFLWLTLLTGVAYPLMITGGALLFFSKSARGSLVSAQGRTVGSALIGQKFESKKYFWPRPSSSDYATLPSEASNLGPTSALLHKAVADRKDRILAAHPNIDPKEIPGELLFSSGSGIDPHITKKAAYFQVDRIVEARKLDPATAKIAIHTLIDTMTTPRRLGFLGEPHVNVLLLNIALDESADNQ